MHKARVFLLFLIVLVILSSSAVFAQYPIIGAEEVKSWMTGKRRVTLIDSRQPDEYQAGHIPGAINIPAERIKDEARRLPKDKTTPIIFYCRGEG
jgi:hydroxyacylglutathione hydrolase